MLVYIKEAHTEDGKQSKRNVREGILVNQPQTQEERDDLAQTCVAELDLHFPTVVDEMGNGTEKAYGALPDRLFVVDAEGRLAYRGDKGPKGFQPEQAEKTLRKLLGQPEEGGVVRPQRRRRR